jgi:hypothetical protein
MERDNYADSIQLEINERGLIEIEADIRGQERKTSTIAGLDSLKRTIAELKKRGFLVSTVYSFQYQLKEGTNGTY